MIRVAVFAALLALTSGDHYEIELWSRQQDYSRCPNGVITPICQRLGPLTFINLVGEHGAQVAWNSTPPSGTVIMLHVRNLSEP